MKDLTDQELIDWWEERAAVREYDGRTGRQRANFLAAKELKERFGVVPNYVKERIRLGEKVDEQRTLFDHDVPN